MSNTYNLIEKEQQFLRDAPIVRQQYSYSLNLSVPNGKQRDGSIVIDADADFRAEYITGKCLGPTDANGESLTAEPTSFPAIGTLLGWAQSGLQMSIKDGGSGYVLVDGFVNVETMLTPGYGIQFHMPFKWDYFIRRNSKLVFTFANRDDAVGSVDLFHSVYITLHGKKFRGMSK